MDIAKDVFAFDSFTHIIDGKPVTSPSIAAVINPSTGEPFAHVPVATHAQLDHAVDAAARAFPSWSAKPWEERADALKALLALIEQHADPFAEMLMKEVGKDRAGAAVELHMGVSLFRELVEHKLEDEVVTNESGRVAKIRHKPYGVCGAIVAFNFPLVLCILKLTHALLAGNCLIIKPPPTAPCIPLKLVELAQSVLPPGVLSVLNGGKDLGQWMVKHPRIQRISFTGSTAAGQAVMREAAAEVKKITLELGGNDPAIVLPDVDVKKIAQDLFAGATSNVGQICFTAKRLFIHEDVYDAVREELVALAKAAKIGDPFDAETTIGPVQNPGQLERLRALIADCKTNGYKIAFEGKAPNSKGYFVPIVIVDNPPEDSRLVREEQFGPIIPLLKWRDDEDVLARANNTEYGLSASVWGSDMERVQGLGKKLDCGSVWINEWGVLSGDLPLIGVKHSGVGVELSKHGLLSWTYVQTFVCKKY